MGIKEDVDDRRLKAMLPIPQATSYGDLPPIPPYIPQVGDREGSLNRSELLIQGWFYREMIRLRAHVEGYYQNYSTLIYSHFFPKQDEMATAILSKLRSTSKSLHPQFSGMPSDRSSNRSGFVSRSNVSSNSTNELRALKDWLFFLLSSRNMRNVTVQKSREYLEQICNLHHHSLIAFRNYTTRWVSEFMDAEPTNFGYQLLCHRTVHNVVSPTKESPTTLPRLSIDDERDYWMIDPGLGLRGEWDVGHLAEIRGPFGWVCPSLIDPNMTVVDRLNLAFFIPSRNQNGLHVFTSLERMVRFSPVIADRVQNPLPEDLRQQSSLFMRHGNPRLEKIFAQCGCALYAVCVIVLEDVDQIHADSLILLLQLLDPVTYGDTLSILQVSGGEKDLPWRHMLRAILGFLILATRWKVNLPGLQYIDDALKPAVGRIAQRAKIWRLGRKYTSIVEEKYSNLFDQLENLLRSLGLNKTAELIVHVRSGNRVDIETGVEAKNVYMKRLRALKRESTG
ncbi:hypothetical protein AAMO2058_000467500 [Amorphochlora amoebiformis]